MSLKSSMSQERKSLIESLIWEKPSFYSSIRQLWKIYYSLYLCAIFITGKRSYWSMFSRMSCLISRRGASISRNLMMGK